MKKKFSSIFLIGVLVLGLTGCGNNETMTDKNNTSNNEKSTAKNISIICSKDDDLKYSVELQIENNNLIKKTETSTWNGKTEKTCNNYKKIAEQYNLLKGVSDTVECDSTSGKRITIYEVDEIDLDEVKLNELKYINSNNEFDINNYKNDMKNDNYTCIEK